MKVMSMGFFQKDEEEAVIWRGSMIHNAINQHPSPPSGVSDDPCRGLTAAALRTRLTVKNSQEMDSFVVVTRQEFAKIDGSARST